MKSCKYILCEWQCGEPCSIRVCVQCWSADVVCA